MALCAKCQRDAPEGALFCPFCSTPIVPPRGEGEPVDPLIGKKINNTYLVQQKIGGGGMGQVYKAIQINLDRPVALKLLRPAFLSDPAIVQRFHREARASSKLHHPNIISVMDFGQIEDGTLFMAMEYVPAHNLLKVMREEFPLGEERVIGIAAQILSALAEAHRAGIVHRDLKPENVMVETRPDEPDFVKVLDFGIAQIQEPSDGQGRLTQAGVVCGTPDYMSPEQAALLPLDARSDLYSVGIMLYEMLAGRHPFQAATPPAMVQAHVVMIPPPMATRSPPGRTVSPALEAVVMRALEKHPENRFQSAEEMRRELLACPLEFHPLTEPSNTSGPGHPSPSPPFGVPRQPTPLRPSSSAVSRPRAPFPSSPGFTPPARGQTPPDNRSPAPLTVPLLSATPMPLSTARGLPAVAPSPKVDRKPPLLLIGGSIGATLILATAGFLYFRATRPQPVLPSSIAPTATEPAPAAPSPLPVEDTPSTTASPAAPPLVAEQPVLAKETPPQEPPAPPSALPVKPTPSEDSRSAPSPANAKPLQPAAAKPSRRATAPQVARSTPIPTPAPVPQPPATAPREPQVPRISSPIAADSTPRPETFTFATREVLAFQQYFGNPELKERGRKLVTGARWLLDANGTLTFIPLETMGGVFPMTARATRDGNRVWFEGRRTARAGSGTAYVRLSGDIALGATNPLLNLDLEIGRAQGAEGAELDPTYRARSRLRLERVP